MWTRVPGYTQSALCFLFKGTVLEELSRHFITEYEGSEILQLICLVPRDGCILNPLSVLEKY